MKEISFAELQKNLENYFDLAQNRDEAYLVKGKDNEELVLISLKEYNSLFETLYLMSSQNNRKILTDAIQNVEAGNHLTM